MHPFTEKSVTLLTIAGISEMNSPLMAEEYAFWVTVKWVKIMRNRYNPFYIHHLNHIPESCGVACSLNVCTITLTRVGTTYQKGLCFLNVPLLSNYLYKAL